MAFADELRRLSLRIAALEAAAQATAVPGNPRSGGSRDRQLEKQIAGAVAEFFDEEELRALAFEAGIDPENVRGSTHKARALAFVSHVARRGWLDILLNTLTDERPHVNWHAMAMRAGNE